MSFWKYSLNSSLQEPKDDLVYLCITTKGADEAINKAQTVLKTPFIYLKAITIAKERLFLLNHIWHHTKLLFERSQMATGGYKPEYYQSALDESTKQSKFCDERYAMNETNMVIHLKKEMSDVIHKVLQFFDH